MTLDSSKCENDVGDESNFGEFAFVEVPIDDITFVHQVEQDFCGQATDRSNQSQAQSSHTRDSECAELTSRHEAAPSICGLLLCSTITSLSLDCCLGRVLPPLHDLPVANTFIHITNREDNGQRAFSSAPSVLTTSEAKAKFSEPSGTPSAPVEPLSHQSSEPCNSENGNERSSSQSPMGAVSPFDQQLPVRNTFIHIAGLHSGNSEQNEQGSSYPTAPTVLMERSFHTKYPLMEEAHLRGDCKPCVYFISKDDGCRWGGECKFCHLCPEGALKKKKKERVKALRKQEWLAKQEHNGANASQ